MPPPPPPPAEPVPVKPAYVDRVRENLLANEDGESLCCSIIQDVVLRAENKMLENYYDRAAVPYTVQCVCREMLDIVQLVFIARDSGEASDAARSSWVPDDEPEPCPTDTWARGSVPVRRAPPHRATSEVDTKAHTPGSASRARTSLVKSGASQGRGHAAALSSGDQGMSSGHTPPQQNRGGSRRRSGGNTPDNRGSPPGGAAEEDAAAGAGGHRAEHRRRMEAKEAAEKQHAAVREAQGPKGGRDYSVDSIAGRVIPVKQMDVGRLPNRKLDMRFGVDTQHAADPGRPLEDAKLASTGARSAAAASSRKHRPMFNRPPNASEFVQPEDSHGPMVEGLQPAGGVMVKEGDRVARGERRQSKSRVTRSDFFKMLDAAGVSRETFDMTQSSQDFSATGGRSPTSQDGGAPPAEDKKKAAEPPPPNAAQQRPQPKADPARRGTQPAAKREPTAPPARRAMPAPRDPGKQPAGAPVAQGIPPLPKFKPPQRSELLGDRLHYPRDRKGATTPRSAVEGRPPALPPPMYPATEGHGTVTGPLAEDNPYAADEATPPRRRHVSPSPVKVKRHSDALGNTIAEDFFADIDEARAEDGI